MSLEGGGRFNQYGVGLGIRDNVSKAKAFGKVGWDGNVAQAFVKTQYDLSLTKQGASVTSFVGVEAGALGQGFERMASDLSVDVELKSGYGIVAGPAQLEISLKQAASANTNDADKAGNLFSDAAHHFSEAISPSRNFDGPKYQ